MSGSDVRVGLVGCGRVAERGYVPALERAAGARLAAVADPELARCTAAAPRVPAFSSAGEMIASADLDAVVLATPASAHLADARIAAAAGLHMLVEKPPAPTLAEALELAALVPAPCFSFNRRFVPALAHMRGAMPADPVELRLELRTRRSSWRSHEARDDALLGLAPHLVDLARWLSGAEVAQVRAACLTPDLARLELALDRDGGRAVIECASNRPYRERVVVTGPSRRIGRYAAGGARAALRAGRGAHPLVPSLACQVEAFARVVRGREEAVLGRAGDGVAVMAVIEAALASAARGCEVAVPPAG